MLGELPRQRGILSREQTLIIASAAEKIDRVRAKDEFVGRIPAGREESFEASLNFGANPKAQ